MELLLVVEAEEALEGSMMFDKAADDLPILRSTSVVALHLHGTAHRIDASTEPAIPNLRWISTRAFRISATCTENNVR